MERVAFCLAERVARRSVGRVALRLAERAALRLAERVEFRLAERVTLRSVERLTLRLAVARAELPARVSGGHPRGAARGKTIAGWHYKHCCECSYLPSHLLRFVLAEVS